MMGCTHCIPKGGEHNPLCAVGRTERAYDKGRVDERAAIVAWLLTRTPEYSDADNYANAVERGDHEVKKP